ncbi:LytR/AlgR family response regulator transcription factor [Clostridium lundense]|uniref:LytR/AlgR family response regulator transcription factor n=1 Tax=Clostridium lundense TaxID=319475 RepID=UPI0004826036|nr:LytTR family DNA-binding domain-containing protein [Clostridium lundense]
MIRIAICEDEFKQRNMLKIILANEIKSIGIDSKINEFENGEKLLNSLKDDALKFDIIFLDIQMNKISGIDAAKKIRENNKSTIIIFVTGFMDYVFEGYNVRAFNYILKPLKKDKIIKVFREALDSLDMLKNQVYILNYKNETHKINFDDVIYFVSNRRIVKLVGKKAEHEFYAKLNDVEKELCDKGFVRCHQSYLINLSNIKSIEQGYAITTLGDKLPISRNRYKETLLAFAKQILK